MNLTEEQWQVVKPHLPYASEPRDPRGRPRSDPRAVLNGILWVLRTGHPWYFLPEMYPSFQTCHRYYRQWTRSGVMKAILAALANDLRVRGGVDITQCIVNGAFVFPREFRLDLSSLDSSSSKSTDSQSAIPQFTNSQFTNSQSTNPRSTWQFNTLLLFYRMSRARAPHLKVVV